MPSDRRGDYEVGYKRPPKETRFRKGNNANPRGRPRGSKNLATLLEEALNTQVETVEDGTRRRRTKRDVVIAQLVDQSANADLRATKLLLDMLHKLERAPASAGAETTSSNTEVDIYELLRTKLARLALAQAGQAHVAGSEDEIPHEPKADKNS
jgi:hypothetical protein